jgi:hypothetical protein
MHERKNHMHAKDFEAVTKPSKAKFVFKHLEGHLYTTVKIKYNE